MEGMGRRCLDTTVSMSRNTRYPIADARSVDICEIEEECPHEMQYLGMCTNCGKDMTT
jgi:hypothetical protein